MGDKARRLGGFSLIELLVVITILGFAAAILIPSAAPYQESTLDHAATELTNALRYARDEAIRSGQYRAIRINKDTGQITVGQPAVTGGEISGFQSMSYNPIDKKLYDLNLNTLNRGVSIDASAAPFTFRNLSGARDTCVFDTDGNPMLITAGNTYGLTAGAIMLTSGVNRRTVAISLVGRITVQ